MKLWTEVVDSKGSTVSQFHSFTESHGGVGSLRMGGVGVGAGFRGQGSGTRKTGNEGARERGSEGVGE